MRMPGASPCECLSGERAAVALVAMLRFTADVRAEEADAKMFLFNEWQQ